MPLTHFDAEGKARMVDVTEKKETVREATATGKIKVSRDVYDAIEAGTVGKGDVLSVATTAGIMGVKRTADLIPMCHILPITNWCAWGGDFIPRSRYRRFWKRRTAKPQG